jgi:hypothetical protein
MSDKLAVASAPPAASRALWAAAIGGVFAVLTAVLLYWKRKRRMNLCLPIISFDTGAHNRLADEAVNSERILSAMKSKFFFRLVGLSYEELVSTPDVKRRLAFLEDCRKLQGGPWDCLNPHYQVLKLLIKAHAGDPAHFQWLTIDVRSGELNHEIRAGKFIADDALSSQQWQEQKDALKGYKQMWVDLRSKLDSAFIAAGKARPTTFKDAFKEYGSQLLPSIGKGLYDGGLKAEAAERGEQIEVDTDIETVKHFIDNCPPFRALLCAVLMSWYHHSARDEDSGERFRAGRNDLFMSMYLPFCDIFVTAEKKGEQERCLREIASVLALKTRILSYDEFTAKL